MAEGTPIGALLVRVGADIGDLVEGFDKADKAVGRFTEKVDRRLLQPLAKITAAAAAAGAAIFALAKDSADTVDQIGKLSQKVGVSVESLSALKYAAQLSDVSLQDLGTGLKQLSKFMAENHIHGVSVEEQLLKIADAFEGAADGPTKTAAAMRYFGKAGADLIPFLNQGRAGIEELRKEAERLGIVFSTEAAKRAEEFNDNLTRLTASAKGMQVEFAGPLVESLNKASQAMLDARRSGESLFSTLIEGYRTLMTGDDLHKWNVDMAQAGDNLVRAQDRLDSLKNAGGEFGGTGEFGQESIKEAEAAVIAAKARIEQLKAIKSILAPEPEKKKDEKKKDQLRFVDPEQAKKDAELIARQAEEQAEIEAKTRAEAAQLMDDNRQKELEKQRAFRMLDLQDTDDYNQINVLQLKALQDERIRILMETYDREQELAIENGEKRIEADEEALAREKQLQRDRLTQTAGALGNLASLMNTSSKRTFEIGKIAAIAEAGVRTAGAAIDAYGWGMKLGGPPLAAAFAATAVVAGLNYMNNLRQQTCGGGGGAPTPAGQGSSGVAAAPTAPGPGAAAPGQTLVIKGIRPEDLISGKMMRGIFERLNDEGVDGARFDRVLFSS